MKLVRRSVFWQTLTKLCLITCLLWVGLQPQVVDTQSVPTGASVVNVVFSQPDNTPDLNRIFDGVNTERIQRGLPALVRNDELTRLAEQRALDMQQGQYYAHKDSSGRYFYDYLDAKRYDDVYACENLDLEYTLHTTVYVNDWMTSKKGHRDCLLSRRTTEAGYAVAIMHLPKVSSTQPLYVVVAIHAGQAN